MEHKRKMAILDMNDGRPNQGMRCIREIVAAYEYAFEIDEFEVRNRGQLPDLGYDVYISSGGPGDPREGDGIWDAAWYQLVHDITKWNASPVGDKKFMFFICHSFQMACHFFSLGELTRRKSTSFGIMPVHHTAAGMEDPLFCDLPDPFYAVDSRDYQVVQPNLDIFRRHGAAILAMEKIRTHVDYERAIMAVRFSKEMIGTQFHPEADPVGMKIHFEKADIRKTVIDAFGRQKYNTMMDHIDDPDKIRLTHSTILPRFIEYAMDELCVHSFADI